MLKISTGTAQGARDYQEDRLVVAYPAGGMLFAVIDGHGGHVVAERVKTRLITLWEQFAATPTIEQRLQNVFAALHTENEFSHDGAAVSVVYLGDDGREAHVAILGDAPVVIRDSEGNINISPEHNVRSNMKEREAVTKRGGYYHGGYAFAGHGHNGLQMSRALGDASLDSILNREPEIYSVRLGDASFILLGTDGVFDPSHQELNVTPIVELIDAGKTAEDLVTRAVKLPTHDNASAILITQN